MRNFEVQAEMRPWASGLLLLIQHIILTWQANDIISLIYTPVKSKHFSNGVGLRRCYIASNKSKVPIKM